MPKLKRDVVKYVRDKAKSRYEKASACRICGGTEQLEFHHYYSLTPLLNQWLLKNKHDPKYIQALRDDFIEEHHAELYEHTVTLCHTHHFYLPYGLLFSYFFLTIIMGFLFTYSKQSIAVPF